MGWMDFHEYLLVADAVRDRLDDLRRTTDSEDRPQPAPESCQTYRTRVRRGTTTHGRVPTGIVVETAAATRNGQCPGSSRKCSATI